MRAPSSLIEPSSSRISTEPAMEKGAASEHKSPLMEELARALQLVRELESHLSHSSPTEPCKSLAPMILSSIQKSILMVQSVHPAGYSRRPAGECVVDSPRSENSSPSFRDHRNKEMLMKRKTQEKWTRQVMLVPGSAGVEGPVEDEYSWRKYGQKDILGAKHPRAYYRCTHRNTQGCAATKQVQRSDDDPLLFDITYLGAHSCYQRPRQQHHQHKAMNFGAAIGTLWSSEAGAEAGPKVKTEGVHSEVLGSSSFLSPKNSESTYSSMSLYAGVRLQSSESDVTEMMPRGNSASNPSIVDVDFTFDAFDFEQDFQFDAAGIFV